MTSLTRLHTGNSALYRPKPIERPASLCWGPAKYQLGGGEQTLSGPHMRVTDGESAYGVDLRVFFATHEPIPGKPDHYLKTAPVRAVQVTDATTIETRVRQQVEMKATIEPGGWLLQNPEGELYYNSAEQFAKRYELVPRTPRATQQTLDEHLAPQGPKRILALDGGGIRGRVTLGILKGIERALGGPLHHHFDLIGGTSTGSIIATGLALGWEVDRLIELYDNLGKQVFQTSFFRRGLWRAKFPEAPLEQALKANFGDVRLGGPELKTGLCIISKRLDTNSVWPLHNHPRGRYYNKREGGSNIPNKNFLLRDLVRASSAAPTYFAPEKLAVSTVEGEVVAGAFVDGGVSPYNNPALQLVLLATLQGYGFGWELGADRLEVVSVGTGSWEVKHSADKLLEQAPVEQALLSLLSLIDDCSASTELLMQWLSDSPTARNIDREVGALVGDVLGNRDPWLSYLRYNAVIEPGWLREHLPEGNFTEKAVASLRQMDNAESLETLAKIGDAAANLVGREHLRG